MPMPVHEQRALERIAERLAADDPDLAGAFRRFAAAHDERHWPAPPATRRRRGPRWAPGVVAALGVALALTGLVLRRGELAAGGVLLVVSTPWLAGDDPRDGSSETSL